jgi:hypothetical protein
MWPADSSSFGTQAWAKGEINSGKIFYKGLGRNVSGGEGGKRARLSQASEWDTPMQ